MSTKASNPTSESNSRNVLVGEVIDISYTYNCISDGTLLLKNGNRYPFKQYNGTIPGIRNEYYTFELGVSKDTSNICVTNMTFLRKKTIFELDLYGEINSFSYNSKNKMVSGSVIYKQNIHYPIKQTFDQQPPALQKGSRCYFRLKQSTDPNYEYEAYIVNEPLYINLKK